MAQRRRVVHLSGGLARYLPYNLLDVRLQRRPLRIEIKVRRLKRIEFAQHLRDKVADFWVRCLRLARFRARALMLAFNSELAELVIWELLRTFHAFRAVVARLLREFGTGERHYLVVKVLDFSLTCLTFVYVVVSSVRRQFVIFLGLLVAVWDVEVDVDLYELSFNTLQLRVLLAVVHWGRPQHRPVRSVEHPGAHSFAKLIFDLP